MTIEAVVCVDAANGISKDGQMPWVSAGKGDLAFVRTLTTLAAVGKKNILIVGRKTYETLPPAFFTADSVREVYVLSNLKVKNSFQDVRTLYGHLLERYYCTSRDIDHIFVFGGAKIYEAFLQQRWIHTFYVTQLPQAYNCDTFFPMHLLQQGYVVAATTAGSSSSSITTWERQPHPEYAYLDLLEQVLYGQGERREGRNSETTSVFGASLEFDVGRHGFPLLTTKKMFFRGIAEELCWFLKADTDARHLQEKKVHIWDGNTSRAALDTAGLAHYAEGDAGPIYGYQWRRFNAPYAPLARRFNAPLETPEAPEEPLLETKQDQLYSCLRLLRDDPHSRRILFSAWNPLQLAQMCLPPCHVLYQFYVSADRTTLSCHMYQRSADLFLGLPFNIASTALLTAIFAHLSNMTVGTIRISIGDAHIYRQHKECVREQLMRPPLPLCQLTVTAAAAHTCKLEQLSATDFLLQNYQSHEPLKAPMVP